MDQKTNITSFNGQDPDINIKDPLQTFGNQSSSANDHSDDNAWYPEQYESSFIAYPR